MERQYPTGEPGERRWGAGRTSIKAAGQGQEVRLHRRRERRLRLVVPRPQDGRTRACVRSRSTSTTPGTRRSPRATSTPCSTSWASTSRPTSSTTTSTTTSTASFMLAGVKDVEAPTDIGFMGVLYRAAEKHGIKHIVEGHSFRTEGVSPLGWLYMDGGYIKAVHEQFGRLPDEDVPEPGLPGVRQVGGVQRHPPASGRCTTSTTTRRTTKKFLLGRPTAGSGTAAITSRTGSRPSTTRTSCRRASASTCGCSATRRWCGRAR